MQGFIEIEPKLFLEFEAEENKIAHAHLSLKNLIQQKVSFKITTTNPTFFQVNPSIGVINPNQTQIIKISTNKPIKSYPKFDTKFQVNACPIDFQTTNLTWFWFWKNLDQPAIKKEQLSVRIKQNVQQGTQSHQQDPESKVIESNLSISQQQDSKILKSVVIEPKVENDDQIKQSKDQGERFKQEYQDFKKKIEIQSKQAILRKDNKRIYKVIVELKVKKIELFIEQWRTTPISCVFHDILVELFQNYQLKIAQPLIFFINGIEIQPFDIQQIQHFETSKGIIINSIHPNEEPEKNSIEKFKFALNTSKQIKRFLRKIIKIQLNYDKEALAYNESSLKEILQNICEDQRIVDRPKEYSMNGEELLELQNIYAMNDFKLMIYYETSQCDFIGDFYQKMEIQIIIDEEICYYHHEMLPINTSQIEFQSYIKFKLFGPNQDNYRQELICQEDYYLIKFKKI